MILDSIVTLGIMTLGISIKCHYAQCRIFLFYAECHYAECRNAECRGAVEASKNGDKKVPLFCLKILFVISTTFFGKLCWMVLDHEWATFLNRSLQK